jgi:hypothetical protein
MRPILRLAVVMCAAAAPAFAQPDANGRGWVPALELRVLSATPEGSQAGASNTWKLVKDGEPIVSTVWTGRTLCTVGIGGAELPQYATEPGTVWKLNGEYLGESGGRQRVRLTSQFVRRVGDGSPEPATSQVLSLREGDHVALDALSAPIDDACHTHTVVMDARLVMEPADPALARMRYAADLWLIHTAVEGEQRRERLVANVDGSAAVPFMFNRLRFALPRLDPRQGDIAAAIELSGSLRARPRADGLVDVDLDTQPFMYRLDNPARPTTIRSPSARKTLTLKPGETTAIDFPAGGMASAALEPGTGADVSTSGIGAAGGGRGRPLMNGVPPPAPPDSGIEVRQNRLVLHPKQFFKGHRTQLLITLRRLQ